MVVAILDVRFGLDHEHIVRSRFAADRPLAVVVVVTFHPNAIIGKHRTVTCGCSSEGAPGEFLVAPNVYNNFGGQFIFRKQMRRRDSFV